MNWGALAALITAEVLYIRAIRVLAGRNQRITPGQIGLWHLGLGLWGIGLLSPIAGAAHDGLTPHMAEHLLIADLAAPLLMVGLRNPVLQHFLPKAVLVPLARRRRLRSVMGTLRKPIAALVVYALVLYTWHFTFAFEAAVEHPAVHALQHGSFVGIGVLVWWAALEPQRRRLRGELWKIGHILAARLIGMFLGMSFVLIREPVYTGVYGSGERALGLAAVDDQQVAGALMLSVDICLMVFALSFFFWRAAQAADAEAEAGAT